MKFIMLLFCLFSLYDCYPQETRQLKDTCLNNLEVGFTAVNTIYTLSHKKDSTAIDYIFYPNGSVRELLYYKKDIIFKKIGWHPNGYKSYEYTYVVGKITGW